MALQLPRCLSTGDSLSPLGSALLLTSTPRVWADPPRGPTGATNATAAASTVAAATQTKALPRRAIVRDWQPVLNLLPCLSRIQRCRRCFLTVDGFMGLF